MRHLVRSVVCAGWVTVSACAAPVGSYDGEEIATSGAKADAASKLTSLGLVTPEEIATVFEARISADLDACLAAHPDIRRLTKTNLTRFVNVGSTWYPTLKDLVTTLLEERDQTSISPSTVRRAAFEHAETRLAEHVTEEGMFDGTIAWGEEGDTLQFWGSYVAAREAKALTASDGVSALDLRALRASWTAIEDALSERNLDADFVPPALLEGGDFDLEANKALIEAYLEVPTEIGGLTSTGAEALEAFGDAVDDDATFAPLAEALRGAEVAGLLLFSASDDGYDASWLAVVDRSGYVVAFHAAYSE